MKEFLQIISEDTYGVAQRIREIDDGYFLVFNVRTKKYEVHNSKNVGNTLSLVCPFEALDVRLVNLVRRTRRERATELVKEVEQNNTKIEKHESEIVLDNAKERAKEIIAKHLKK